MSFTATPLGTTGSVITSRWRRAEGLSRSGLPGVHLQFRAGHSAPDPGPPVAALVSIEGVISQAHSHVGPWGDAVVRAATTERAYTMAETVKKGARITGADRAKLAGELTKKYAGQAEAADQPGDTSFGDGVSASEYPPPQDDTAQVASADNELQAFRLDTVPRTEAAEDELSTGSQAVTTQALMAD